MHLVIPLELHPRILDCALSYHKTILQILPHAIDELLLLFFHWDTAAIVASTRFIVVLLDVRH